MHARRVLFCQNFPFSDFPAILPVSVSFPFLSPVSAPCLAPLLTELRWCDALDLFEDAAEIMRCTKTAPVADVLQLLIRKAQHLLGLCDTEVPDIGMDTDPELLLEHTGKMELADKKTVCQLIQHDHLRIVRFQVVPNWQQVLLFLRPVRILCRMPRLVS